MKRALDLTVAVSGLLLLGPVLVLLAVLVKATSRGPVLYVAGRTGRGGEPFGMLKFRTMRVDADASGPPLARASDARITPVGRVLRRTHLDELPQLGNVLMGQMSLVGPRPEDPRFVDVDDPKWQRILSVRPGVTGPTQLEFAGREQALLGDGDVATVYRRQLLPHKIESDVYYVETRSFGGDLALLLRSVAAVVRGGAR